MLVYVLYRESLHRECFLALKASCWLQGHFIDYILMLCLERKSIKCKMTCNYFVRN